VFRTIRKKNPQTGKSYPWITRGSALPNHDYFCLLDVDFGPLFIKFCSNFPYAVKVCLNGHEWVKQPLTQEDRDACPSRFSGSIFVGSDVRCRVAGSTGIVVEDFAQGVGPANRR